MTEYNKLLDKATKGNLRHFEEARLKELSNERIEAMRPKPKPPTFKYDWDFPLVVGVESDSEK